MTSLIRVTRCGVSMPFGRFCQNLGHFILHNSTLVPVLGPNQSELWQLFNNFFFYFRLSGKKNLLCFKHRVTFPHFKLNKYLLEGGKLLSAWNSSLVTLSPIRSEIKKPFRTIIVYSHKMLKKVLIIISTQSIQ